MFRRSSSLALVVGLLALGAARLAADELPPIAKHADWVTAVAFSPDGQTLATVGGETLLYRPGYVKLWDLATGQEKANLEGHTACVWSVAFSPDGKWLATSSYDRQLKLWDLAAGKEQATLSGHKNWVTSVVFSPDSATLASASEDGTIRLWDVASAQPKSAIEGGHAGMVRGIAWSPDGT
ncbi:MAG: WD40 repeat domain-containing protein, partial [Pirellulales bacterium]